MYSSERQEEIAHIIDVEGRVTVAELSKRFAVTSDCIRKDLRQLVAQGRCRKVYGGAVRIEGEVNRNIAERVDTLRPEKQAIAAKALELIRPRQTIYLDFSSINILLGEMIAASRMSLTVVSNSVDVMRAVARGGSARAFCPRRHVQRGVQRVHRAARGARARRLPVRRRVHGRRWRGRAGRGRAHARPRRRPGQAGGARAREPERAAVRDRQARGARGTYRYASLDDFDIAICDEDRPGAIAALRDSGINVL